MKYQSTVRWFATVLILAIGVAQGNADPITDAARTHFAAGKALFDKADFRGAMSEFAAADKLSPSPLLDYNIALCYERLDDKAEAARRYRSYLQKSPNASNRAQVEQKIQTLEAASAAPAAPAPIPPPVAPPAPSAGPGVPAITAGPSGMPTTPAASATTGAAAPTGDPELDRIAGMNVREIRDQRQGYFGGTQPNPAGPNAGPNGGITGMGPGGPGVPAGNANGQAMSQGGLTPQNPGQASQNPGQNSGQNPATNDGSDKAKEPPVYKQWWFWAVVGISAIIVIDIATSESDKPSTTQPVSRETGLMLRF